MNRPRLTLACVFLAALAGPAAAGEAACRFEAGVVVVAAEAAGIAGDYILDTGAAQTLLHKTRVEAEGIAGTELSGGLRLAGMTVPPIPMKVADLDMRTWNLPTPVAGVIGVDALRAYVLDVDFDPCRLRLSAPGETPRFRGRTLALDWDLGRPWAAASVFDGERELSGPFVLATGANAPVRIADDLALPPGGPRPEEYYPPGVWLARLPALAFAGGVGEDVAAGMMPVEGDVAGVIGGPVLAKFRLRFDFPRSRLVVAPGR